MERDHVTNHLILKEIRFILFIYELLSCHWFISFLFPHYYPNNHNHNHNRGMLLRWWILECLEKETDSEILAEAEKLGINLKEMEEVCAGGL